MKPSTDISRIKLALLTWILVCSAALLCLAQTGAREIPPYEGDGNSLHDGQPKFCQARDENGYKKNCGICDRRCGEAHNDSKCKVYCRAKACRCHPECAPTGHVHHDTNGAKEAESR